MPQPPSEDGSGLRRAPSNSGPLRGKGDPLLLDPVEELAGEHQAREARNQLLRDLPREEHNSH